MGPDPPQAIFIVGNSRSGTTLLASILGRGAVVHTLRETHFFEQLWLPAEGSDTGLGREAAITLASTLLGIAAVGRRQLHDVSAYRDEANRLLAAEEGAEEGAQEGAEEGAESRATRIYERFLEHETRKHGKKIPCEQTPRNVFFLRNILALFPRARIVVMIRDPRDVLVSQKHRWKRARLDGLDISFRETLRTWANYHPIVTSRLWRAAVQAGRGWAKDDRVTEVRFEDLVTQPAPVVARVCRFLDIEFDEAMLDVPASRSPAAKGDETSGGISGAPVGRWRRSLGPAETYWCERITGPLMTACGYERSHSRLRPLAVAASLATLPIKAVLALALNTGQSRNVAASIRRRLAW